MKYGLAVGAVGLGLAATALPTQPDATWDVRDLDGTYYYTLCEVRGDVVPLDYCDEYGTITFDGEGNAVATGTRKCSTTGPATQTNYFTYTVSPSGEVLITEVGFPLPTRGQIVDKGRMILVDGTTREPFIYIQHGVAVEQ